ncbi:MAG: hypothetical protein M9913_04500 [Bryobacteraceae bacterium]|nr:hypothetical protein [Solibacteraceae bacterium]MCO5350158.1 hypothetical protein [Bryobacteraceae bacterium]
MNVRFPLFLSLLLATLLAGCARHTSGPRAFRYSGEGILFPPASKAPVEVLNVRGSAPRDSGCTAAIGPFSLRWRKSTALLHLPPSLDSTFPDQPLEDFHTAIFALEARSCLISGGAARVLDAFASSLSLPARSLYFARYGVYYNSSALNVEPGFVLKLVSPLLRPGSGPLVVDATIPDRPGPIDVRPSDNLEGFETSTYQILPQRPSGVRLQLASVEQNRQGISSAARQPSAFRLNLPPDARHLRLLFLRRKSASDRDITLVAAPSLQLLDESARRIQAAPDAGTACSAEPAGRCLLLPQFTALNLELLVKVNGRSVSVPVGGTVGHAIASAGLATPPHRLNPESGSLHVRRPWHGKAIPIHPDDPTRLFSLVLLGGEEIQWTPGLPQPQ